MAGKRLGFRRGLCRSCGPVEETEEKVRKPGKFRNSSATRSAGFLTDFPQADEGPRRDGNLLCNQNAYRVRCAHPQAQRWDGARSAPYVSCFSRFCSTRSKSGSASRFFWTVSTEYMTVEWCLSPKSLPMSG